MHSPSPAVLPTAPSFSSSPLHHRLPQSRYESTSSTSEHNRPQTLGGYGHSQLDEPRPPEYAPKRCSERARSTESLMSHRQNESLYGNMTSSYRPRELGDIPTTTLPSSPTPPPAPTSLQFIPRIYHETSKMRNPARSA